MRAFVSVLLTCFAWPAAAQDGPRAPRPAGLQAVSPHALGFVHLRLADVWHGELGQAVRRKLPKETGQLTQRLEGLWGVAPADIESVTMVFPGPESQPAGGPPPLVQPPSPRPAKKGEAVKPRPEPVAQGFNPVIVTTVRAYDRDRVRDAVVPRAETRTHRDRIYLVSAKPGTPALHFVNDRVFLWATEPQMKRLLGTPVSPDARGPLDDVLKLAAERHHLAGGFNLTAPPLGPFLSLYKLAAANSPELKHLQPLLPLFEARIAAFACNLGPSSAVSLHLFFEDEARAKQARKPAEALAGLAHKEAAPLLAELSNERGVPNLLRVLKQVDAAARTPVVEHRGKEVIVTLHIRSDAALVAEAALEAMNLYAREAVRTRSADKLRKIGEAIEVYDNLHNHYPIQAISGKDGKSLLSWRVAILPHLGEDELFKQFKLDEPWDSPHNHKLLEKMPEVYASPTARPAAGLTFYRGFAGKGAFFDGDRKLRYSDITDGTPNTIMVIEAGEAVPWTRPDELPFDADQPLPKLGGVFPEGFHALFCDGRTVHFIKKGVSEQAIKALVTRAGGEKVDLRKAKP